MKLEIDISNLNNEEGLAICNACAAALKAINEDKKKNEDLFLAVMTFEYKHDDPIKREVKETTPFTRYMSRREN